MSPGDPASTAAGVAAAHATPTGDAAMETTAAGARRAPLILFGAFDRHNLGDLLLGRIAAELAAHPLPGRDVRFAGLAARDLRADGGARVQALAELVLEWHPAPREGAPAWLPASPPALIQVGGEILGCSAWEAAVMLLDPAGAARAIAVHDRDPVAREAWARQTLESTRGLPYLAAHAALPPGTRIVHTGIGGVGFAALPAALRAEALDEMRAAARVQVRDRRTRDALAAAGIEAELVPDPAVLVERLLGAEVARHAALGEPAMLRARFAHGYVAVQLAAELGDDATLAALADDLAAISPALSLVGGAQQVAKLRAWLDTWYPPQRHHLAAPGNLRALAHSVLNEAPDERKAHAAHLADLGEAAAHTAYARLFDPIDPEDNSP